MKLNKNSNIWFTNKHIMQNTIYCGTVQFGCTKMVILFLFLELGTFSLKLGKKSYVIGNKTLYRLSKWTRNSPDNVIVPDVYCMFDNKFKNTPKTRVIL